MADNTTLNPGVSGDVIATDDIAGVKHQRVKVEWGADGSATDVSPTAPLPVVPQTEVAGVGIGAAADAEAAANGSVIALLKRLRTLIAAGLPAALVGGRVDVNVGNSPTVKTKTPLTASAPAAASVGVASAQAVAANANRTGLTLVNTSDNTISLGFGATAVLNSGITLLAGASWAMNEYSFTTAAVNAIAGAASSNLAVQEFV